MTTNQPSIPTCLASSSEATVALLPSLVTCGEVDDVGPHPAADQARHGEPDRPRSATSSRAGTTRETTRAREPASGTRSRRRSRARSRVASRVHLGRHPRHPGPEQVLEVAVQRRATRDTRRRSSSRSTRVAPRVTSLSRTSVVPGWVRSTSLSCSTTGGVHRVEGIVISDRSDAAVVHRRRGDALAAQLGLVLAAVEPALDRDRRCPRPAGCWPAGSRWGRTARRWRPRGPRRSRSPRRRPSW